MAMGLLLILILGTMIGGFLLAGALSFRELDDEWLQNTQLKTATAVRKPAARAARSITIRPRFDPNPIVHALERRLRHEFVLARAFADNPSIESLWA